MRYALIALLLWPCTASAKMDPANCQIIADAVTSVSEALRFNLDAIRQQIEQAEHRDDVAPLMAAADSGRNQLAAAQLHLVLTVLAAECD